MNDTCQLKIQWLGLNTIIYESHRETYVMADPNHPTIPLLRLTLSRHRMERNMFILMAGFLELYLSTIILYSERYLDYGNKIAIVITYYIYGDGLILFLIGQGDQML